MMCGGHSNLKTPDAEDHEEFNSWKPAVEAACGETYATFEVVGYTSQVVAGTNFQLKIHVGDQKYVHAKVFRPLPHTGNPASVSNHKTGCTLDDGFAW